ncbi:hypothetical protein DMN91_001119 [Ooceraea biroi]|uniref:Uncharacterized protein n=1 Tax=Ooceraea biroi TaxID=2015173 RepID=A0A3L8E6G6_OOCBI|nr:hypothetical protein DMN91_001119 [Ooceraea biroi]
MNNKAVGWISTMVAYYLEQKQSYACPSSEKLVTPRERRLRPRFLEEKLRKEPDKQGLSKRLDVFSCRVAIAKRREKSERYDRSAGNASQPDYHVQPLAAGVSLALYSLSAGYACEVHYATLMLAR